MARNKIFLLALVILIIGGINWGLVGFFSFDLIAKIFGQMSFFSRIIYACVGISAILAIFTCPKEN